MEKPDNLNEDRSYIRAKKRVEELKGYYKHLAIYVIVNSFLSGAQIVDGISEDKTFKEIFSDFGIYAIWLFWGIGLFFHTLNTFGLSKLLGPNWQERKVKEYMNDKS
jgi:hypothetical protein